MAKKNKAVKQLHTANTQKGMGEYVGGGIKNPVGKMRKNTVSDMPVSKKLLNKPPKSLA